MGRFIGGGNFHTIVIQLTGGTTIPLGGNVSRFLLGLGPIYGDTEGCIIGGSIVLVDLTEGDDYLGNCKVIGPMPNLISEGEWINEGANISSLATIRFGEGDGTGITTSHPEKTSGLQGLDDSFGTFFEFRCGRFKGNLFTSVVTGNFSFGELVAEEFVFGVCHSGISCI
jgi:hypothetical protein